MRAIVFGVPIAAAFGAAWLAGTQLPQPHGFQQTAATWFLFLASSTTALIITDRAMRRLLPLAWLLKLSLVFPDRVPSRLAIARKAGSLRRVGDELEAIGQDRNVDPDVAAGRILSLIASLARHDPHTRGHSERVRALTELVAEEMGLSAEERSLLRWSALLHDVGKLTVAPDILNKPTALEENEWEVIRKHPTAGARYAAPLLPWLGQWAAAIEQHHERMDGRGYPKGLGHADISLAARIVGVADSYETMTAARAYKRPLSPAAAREELARHAGTQFDPTVVRAFLNLSITRLRRALGIVGLGWLPLLPQGIARVFEGLAPAGLAAGTVGGAIAFGIGLLSSPALAPLTPVPQVLAVQHLLPPAAPVVDTTQAPNEPKRPATRAGHHVASADSQSTHTKTNHAKPKPSPSPQPAPDPTTTYVNHGDCVSSVALITPPGPDHGFTVSSTASRNALCL